jgi:hypothetical protein
MAKAKRKDRLKQLAYPASGGFSYSSFSPDLLQSANLLLERALFDRYRGFAQNDMTHATAFGAGAVVLAVTAFDVWLSELIVGLILPGPELPKRIDRDVVTKYSFLYGRFHGANPQSLSGLETVTGVRDEIVHHFPRLDLSLTPDWLPVLQRQDLLVTHELAPHTDYTLTQKLGSYGLAYWVFREIEARARALIEGASDSRAQFHLRSLDNFGLYRSICPPENVTAFDAQQEARLTNP